MRLAAALLAFAAAAPALAQTAEQDYQAGVAARLAGDPARAITLLERATVAEPRNSDAWLQLGLAQLAAGNLDHAEAAFRRTLSLAPDYTDARIGLARVAQRRGDRAAALAALEPVDPSNAEASALRRQLAVLIDARGAEELNLWRWRLDLDGNYSWVEQQQDWKEGAIRLGYQPSPGTLVSGGVELSRRFGRTDTYGELRAERRFSPGANGYVFFGATPNADFRPEWQVGLGGGVRVSTGPTATVLTLDARHAEYRSGDIQTLSPGIEQYLANGNAWISARWINIWDEDGDHQSGWLARGDVLASPRLRLFAGLSDAPDTSEGVVIDTFSVFGGLSYDVTDRSTLRLSLAHEDRENGFDRLQLGLGMGWRF
ncbi:MAG TPA: YaiO family outer membrane beta-barrel protein [Allosphingosinicella sp.]|uniref:YaiO family outer membrane beta-barrel protein n=1 Tax=Allosphingosinicella sp. TaxID=2823234 RepID=UPI002EDA2720